MRTRWEYYAKGLKQPPQVVSAGYKGKATAGDHGLAIAGYYGKATAGDHGIAIAGICGIATAGYGGQIHIRWFDLKANRNRTAVGYVGENGLKPNTLYKVDDQGNFVEIVT